MRACVHAGMRACLLSVHCVRARDDMHVMLYGPRSLIHVGRVTNHVGLVFSIMSSLDPTKSPKLHGLGSTEPTSSVESITSTKLQVSAELLPDEKSDVALSAAPVSEAFCFEDIDL